MFKHYFSEDYLAHITAVTHSKRQTFLMDDLAINFFIKSGPFGDVINSAPFFGSHGGFYKPLNGLPVNFEKLSLDEIVNRITGTNVNSLTIVENPYSGKHEKSKIEQLVNRLKQEDPFQYRIVNRLSSAICVEDIGDEDELIKTYHQKTRNCLRKYLKSGTEIVTYNFHHEEYDKSLKWVFDNHNTAIKSKGGKPKPWSYFSSLNQFFGSDRIDLKIARLHGQPVGGLLNFKLENQREYWTPVTTAQGMQVNVMYGLIHDTLLDIVGKANGCLNFGGSWPSQTDLIRFKNRFGANELPYRYHCFLRNNELATVAPALLSEHYEFFFVRDFSD